MAESSGEGRGGMHQEDVLRSGLVWVEIGGVRKFKFLNRGVVGYFNLTSVGWLLQLNFGQPPFQKT